jgi:hypothetical protein
VVCGRSGELENALLLLPVGCCEPKSVSEEKVDPVVVDVVGVEGPKDVVGTGGLLVRNEDATLVKVVVGAPVC